MPIDEMRHVLARIGDPLTQEEIANFINIVDTRGDGYIRMEDMVGVLLPQTNKDIYARTVNDGDALERGQMSYGMPKMGLDDK